MIIESAARLIDQVGYTHLTMDMLSQEAGIAKATLYQHFKSKEEVVTASTLHELNNLERFMLASKGKAIEQLRAIMRYMMVSTNRADGFSSVVMHDEVLHLFNHHEAIRAKFQQLNLHFFHLVEEARHDGDIADDLPSEIVITTMMNILQIYKGRLIYPAVDQLDFITLTIRIFFNGLKHH